MVADAMSGSDSNGSLLNGGRGGRLAVTRVAIPPDVNEADRSSNAMARISSGGIGYNGCSVSPTVQGTEGGAAGNLLVPAGLSGAPTDSHKGGRGGDGTPPGGGGAPGTDETTGCRSDRWVRLVRSAPDWSTRFGWTMRSGRPYRQAQSSC